MGGIGEEVAGGGGTAGEAAALGVREQSVGIGIAQYGVCLL